MRILILGAGGIGGYFGARLQAGGSDVTFLVRPARAAALQAGGLKVNSPLGDVAVTPRLLTAVDSAFDLVLLSCKAYDLDSALTAIAPAVGPNTVVLPLLNGVAHLDRLDARFGRARVAGGVAHLALTLDADGGIRHLNATEKLIVGARDPAQQPVIAALGDRLAALSPDYTLSADIEQAMWDKLVFIATLAGATCLMRAPIGDILDSCAGPALIAGLLDEAAAVATASGHPPTPAHMDGYRAVLTQRGSTLTASMLRDLQRDAPTEAEHIFGDLRARAARHALATPWLDLAHAHLEAAEARRRRVSESAG